MKLAGQLGILVPDKHCLKLFQINFVLDEQVELKLFPGF